MVLFSDTLYHYRVQILKVIDGDTVDVLIDLGFSLQHKVRLRLNRIDAPEMRGPSKTAGEVSRTALENMLVNHYDKHDGEIVCRTVKDKQDKYGRYLADIYIGTQCINDTLVEQGYAVYRAYTYAQEDDDASLTT